MKILCMVSSLDNLNNNILYKLAKTLLLKKMSKDITTRSTAIHACVNKEEIVIDFISTRQSPQAFMGLRPDILILQGNMPESLAGFIDAVTLTGGLILKW